MSDKRGKQKLTDFGKLSTSASSLFSAARSKTTEGGNDVNELESLFIDMMLCVLCGEVFREPLRLPKALPCTHTYCSACLTRHLHGSILECPDCGSHYDIRGNISTLPNSAMVMRVLNKVCKLCHTMAKLEECPHCKLVSCAVCLKSHLIEIREELYIDVREISTATEKLSSKQNWIDAALSDVVEKSQRVKTEVAYQTDQLIELVTNRHERVMDQIEKEVVKERKRLNNIKKSLVDTQDTNLALCSGLTDELEQPVQMLAARFSSMKNNCAVQLDKIKREQAAILSLDWDLVLSKPDQNYIKKELDELQVGKAKFPKPMNPNSPRLNRVRIAHTSSSAAHHPNQSNANRNRSFAEGNTSFAKTNAPTRGRSESSF